MKQSDQIPFSTRLCPCVGAWIVAILGMTGGWLGWDGIIVAGIYTPLGLLIAPLLSHYSNRDAAVFIMAGFGWLYYVGLTIWSLRATKRSVFVCVFAVLCISFFLIIVGCEPMGHAPRRM
jgi:hypothetical protein